MIMTALINTGAYIANLILFIFPDSNGFPAEVTTAFETLGGYVGILDPIVPIATLLTCLLLIVTFELTLFAFKAIRWLFGFVPFMGGRG